MWYLSLIVNSCEWLVHASLCQSSFFSFQLFIHTQPLKVTRRLEEERHLYPLHFWLTSSTAVLKCEMLNRVCVQLYAIYIWCSILSVRLSLYVTLYQNSTCTLLVLGYRTIPICCTSNNTELYYYFVKVVFEYLKLCVGPHCTQNWISPDYSSVICLKLHKLHKIIHAFIFTPTLPGRIIDPDDRCF